MPSLLYANDFMPHSKLCTRQENAKKSGLRRPWSQVAPFHQPTQRINCINPGGWEEAGEGKRGPTAGH
jgi:hypothetical protein